MAITANFYSFSKKSNSTKQPTGTGTSYNIELCEDVSILTPRIILKGANLSDYMGGFNYAYISTFGRYYFIRDIMYNAQEGFWHMSLEVDVLATLKTSILGTTQFVERSASHYDLDMIDSLYPTKATPTKTYSGAVTFFDDDPASGYYIVGINNNRKTTTIGGTTYNMPKFGSVTYYVLTAQQLRDFTNYLMGVDNWVDDNNNPWWVSATAELKELLGTLTDPLQFVTTCKFVPKKYIFDFANVGTTLLYFGNVPGTTTGYLLDQLIPADHIVHKSLTIAIEDHPQKVTHGGWTNSNRLTSRVLRFEPFGLIPLDCTKLMGFSYIYCDVAIDLVTGIGILSIYGLEDNQNIPSDITTLPLLGTYTADVLIDIPVSQMRHKGYVQSFIDYIAIPAGDSIMSFHNTNLSSMAGGVSSIAGGPWAWLSAGAQGASNASVSANQGMQNLGHSIIDGTKEFWGTPRSAGTSGSLLCCLPVRIYNTFFLVTEEFIGDFGKPLYEPYPLATLIGFVKCMGSEFASAYTSAENEAVKSFMDSGFFIE